MDVTYDPVKRHRTLVERGLDFADVASAFAGVTYELEDTRKNYGEHRYICYGYLNCRMVVIGYTVGGANRHVFSVRKANEREQTKIAPLLRV
ncbi:MAG: BrnT family toxin [Pseudomonadota bacterium]